MTTTDDSPTPPTRPKPGGPTATDFCDHLQVGVFHADVAGLCAYANTRWHEIHGLPAASCIGLPWTHLMLPAEVGRAQAAWAMAIARTHPLDIQCRILRPDGATRLVHARAQAPDIGQAAYDGLIGTVEDITDRVAADERRRANESFLDRTGKVAGVGGWELDLRTNHLVWSPQTRALHEVPPDFEPTLDNAIAFYSEEARPLISEAVARALETGSAWDLELPLVTARGRPMWVRACGEVESEAGVPVRLLGAFQDVTAVRQRKFDLAREQALRLQSEQHTRELSELLRERSEMLDVLAHEVRQPLNNASAALQSAMGVFPRTPETAGGYRLQRAQAVLGGVIGKIDNTLAVAALLARPGPIQRVETDVEMMVSFAIADMSLEDRPRLKAVVDTRARTVSVDPSLIRLALRNLLDNALRHGRAGSAVEIVLSDHPDEPALLCLDVVDHGGGIGPDLIPRLFERGARQRQGSASTQGLGLGLYIVRRVMELHGSRVELAANSDAGATMRLVLEQGGPGQRSSSSAARKT